MKNHQFILTPGHWVGEGKIQLNMIEDELLFEMNWDITKADKEGKIYCTQEIQIQGLAEFMQNELVFYQITKETFMVDMSNQNIEGITGSGLIDNSLIAWEFRETVEGEEEDNVSFEGFETYKKLDDGTYAMRAEYVTSDQFRTKIEGKIRQKAKTRDTIQDKEVEG